MLNVIKNLAAGQCYVVKTGDDFLSEYPLEALNRMDKLTKFTGSNGIAMFFANNKKILLTDSRYTLQAKSQLPDFEIMDISFNTFKSVLLQNNISTMFANTKLFSYKFCQDVLAFNVLIKHNNEDEGCLKINYKNISKNFVNFNDELTIFGESSESKMQKLCIFMRQNGIEKLLITDPHNIAYLLNKRGVDNKNTPIKYCFMLVSVNDSICNYKIFDNDNLYGFTQDVTELNVGVFGCSQYVFSLLKDANCKVSFLQNIVESWMIIKNNQELENIRKIALLDSKILTNFFAEVKKMQNLNEILIADKLYHERQKYKEFISNSFDTICGFNANGAIVHYKASNQTCKQIEDSGLLLVDSGGQLMAARLIQQEFCFLER